MSDHSGQQIVILTLSGGGKIQGETRNKKRPHIFHMEIKKLNS
jgi:hypothetical protein